MKKLISLCLALLLLISVCGAAFAEDKPFAGRTLTISTFAFNAELLQKNIYDPFMELTGCTIVADGASNAVRVTKLAEAAAGDYDVVIIGDMFVKQLMAEGKIDTLDSSKLTNLDALYDNAKAPMGEGYGPAYTFNRLGIVYDPDACPVEIKSFADLWNPELKDYIAIPAITNTSGPLFYYGVAAAFGLEPGKDDDAIFAKLAELKPNVKSTYTSANNTITMLNQGEICAAVLLDYSYTTAKSANPAYVWVNPAEGLFGGYNMLNIITGSKNKELAEAFIDFYLSYDVQYAEAMDGVDSPVRTDIVLDEEHAQNFTYGDMVNQLILPDWDFVTANLAAWTERWNETFSVQ
ncbi:MAG: extracellular solute-binding protein [Clostridia bacterium]|nr:extracellular solute-binding protein [Clostridia bacterium]